MRDQKTEEKRYVTQSDCTGRVPNQCWDCDCPIGAEHMYDCRQASDDSGETDA